MMENLEIGLQLLIVGLCTVFFVLVLLMYVMKTMSALVGKFSSGSKIQSQTAAGPGAAEDDQELAVVLAVALDTVTGIQNSKIRLSVREAE
jgi:sodium pump decarboxylase gamma subunit